MIYYLKRVKNLKGKIIETPYFFSLKREGKRLYQHAREGNEVEIKAQRSGN